MQVEAANVSGRLFVMVAAGALLVTIGSWTLGYLAPAFVSHLPFPGWIAAVLAVLIPDGLIAIWIWRRLSATLPQAEARRIVITFVVSTPAALMAAYLVGDGVQSDVREVFGARSALPAFIVFVLLVMAIVPAAFVEWDRSCIRQRSARLQG